IFGYDDGYVTLYCSLSWWKIRIVNDLLTDFNGSYIKSLINSLGYDNVIKLYYCDPLKNLQSGVRFLGYEDCTFAKFSSLYLILHYDPTTVYGDDYEPKLDGVLHITLGDDIDYDEEGSDIDDAKVTDAREKLSLENNMETKLMNELKYLNRVAEGDLFEFESPKNFDDENECGFLLPHLVSHKKQQMRKESWEFEDVVELGEAITIYSISTGSDIKYFKNDKIRIGAKCKEKDRGYP
ncbi:Serine/threonine-protein kinase RUNKEL, partial [Bienertia sinuspersici]